LKLKNLSLIILLGLVILLSTNAGLCTEDIAQHIPAVADTIPTKPSTGISITASKFLVTMIGVVLSSIIIWAGLSIYNKFFVKSNFQNGKLPEDTMYTPKTIEEAVTFFIKKNRLK